MNNNTYRELFERSADAILIIVDEKFTDCNNAALKMLGFKNKQDLFNTHPSELSPEQQPDGQSSYEKANEMISTAFEKGSHRFEWDHKRANGEIFPVEVLLTDLTDDNQKKLHVVWREISDRKKIEEKLLRLTSIVESTSDMVSTATPDGKIQYINSAGLKMLGWKAEEVSEKTIHDVHPDTDRAKKTINRIISEVISKGIWIGESTIRSDDHRKVPVSQVVMSHNDVKGNLEYFSTIIRDISDRKESEKTLENNLRYLNSIIKNQPTCVKLISVDGKVIDMNPAGLNMIAAPSREGVIGKNVYTFLDEENQESFRKFNEKVCNGEKSEICFSMKTFDGRTINLESIAVPLQYGPSGETVQLGITRDITQELSDQAERRKLEDQLNQARKMESIGNLAGGIAHDFNNILSAIMGNAELAIIDMNNQANLKEDLNEILTATNRAKMLVKQILTFSRKSDHDLRPVRAQSILKETLRLLRSSIPTTIEIRQEIDPGCRKILADPTQIHQIIMNLCTNAYHAMQEQGGVLRVTLEPADQGIHIKGGKNSNEPDECIRLTVADTGNGISKDILDNIFEPYYTTKEVGEGTGLGLAVVHGIVSSMHGKITVNSEPGKGTTFNVYLPVVELKEKRVPLMEPESQRPKGNEQILLVDDDKAIAKMNKSMLEKSGYRVTAMSSSREAFQVFQYDPEKFDIIMTDMTMPQMTGAELARKILAIRYDIPIILCTGYNDLINEQKAKDIGIREYILKPVRMDDLIKKVRKALDDPPSDS